MEECGPCPVFAGFTLAFALQLRKKHGKTSVRVAAGTMKIQLVKGKMKVNLTLEKATKTHRGSKGIALLFL